jgi:hypothetical protein
MELDGAPVLNDVVTMKAVIDLQFVGVEAEQFAQSVQHWDSRADVHRAFSHVGAQLMCSSRRISAVPYFQDGANSVQSFNITVYVVWANVQHITETPLNFAQLDGNVIVSD